MEFVFSPKHRVTLVRKVTESEYISKYGTKWLKDRSGGFWYKIPDTLGVGNVKPFDVIALYAGTTYAIEAKLHKTHTAFPLSKIEPHQIMNLRMAARNGAISTVLIGVRFLMDLDTRARLGLRRRRVCMDLAFGVDEIHEKVTSGVKSIEILPFIREAENEPEEIEEDDRE